MSDTPTTDEPVNHGPVAPEPMARPSVTELPTFDAFSDAPAVDVAAVEMAVAEMETAPARNASDAYVFAALVCAVVGILIPILPAAAALMLLRATDEDLTGEPLRPQLTGVASFARGLAWFDLAWMTLLVVALLLGIFGKVAFT